MFGLLNISRCLAIVIVFLSVTHTGWGEESSKQLTREYLLKVMPVSDGVSKSDLPTDQALKSVTRFLLAFNRSDQKTIKASFVNKNHGEEFARKSKLEYWTVRMPDRGEYREQQIRDEIVRLVRTGKGPQMPIRNPAVVIVAKDNKSAFVWITQIRDPFLSDEPRAVVYELRRKDKSTFLINDIKDQHYNIFPGDGRVGSDGPSVGDYILLNPNIPMSRKYVCRYPKGIMVK